MEIELMTVTAGSKLFPNTNTTVCCTINTGYTSKMVIFCDTSYTSSPPPATPTQFLQWSLYTAEIPTCIHTQDYNYNGRWL